VLAREDVEVHLHAPETKTEHFWRCVWTNCHIEKIASMLGNNMWTSGCVYGRNVTLKN
jgi:hypothetical protein